MKKNNIKGQSLLSTIIGISLLGTVGLTMVNLQNLYNKSTSTNLLTKKEIINNFIQKVQNTKYSMWEEKYNDQYFYNDDYYIYSTVEQINVNLKEVKGILFNKKTNTIEDTFTTNSFHIPIYFFQSWGFNYGWADYTWDTMYTSVIFSDDINDVLVDFYASFNNYEGAGNNISGCRLLINGNVVAQKFDYTGTIPQSLYYYSNYSLLKGNNVFQIQYFKPKWTKFDMNQVILKVTENDI